MTLYDPNAGDNDHDGLIRDGMRINDREWSGLVQSLLQEAQPKRRSPKWGSVVLGSLVCIGIWTALLWVASVILTRADFLPHPLGFVDSLALAVVLLVAWIMLRAMANPQG